MKTWILTAAILLATATAANAGWTRCETIRVFPGFSIQRCDTAPHDAYGRHYRGYANKWNHGKAQRHPAIAGNHYRFDSHYYGRQGYPRWNCDFDKGKHQRDRFRW